MVQIKGFFFLASDEAETYAESWMNQSIKDKNKMPGLHQTTLH